MAIEPRDPRQQLPSRRSAGSLANIVASLAGNTSMADTGGRATPSAPPPAPTDPMGNLLFPEAGTGSGGPITGEPEGHVPGTPYGGPGGVPPTPNIDFGPMPGDPDYNGSPGQVPTGMESPEKVPQMVAPPPGKDVSLSDLAAITQVLSSSAPSNPLAERQPMPGSVAQRAADNLVLPPLGMPGLPAGSEDFFAGMTAPGDLSLGGLPAPAGSGQMPTPGQVDDVNPPSGGTPGGYDPVTGMNPIYNPATRDTGSDLPVGMPTYIQPRFGISPWDDFILGMSPGERLV